MLPPFAPQCCDAQDYLDRGAACARSIDGCWDPLRPIGMSIYSSIPFRLHVPPESIILINILVITTAAYFFISLLKTLAPRVPRSVRVGAVAVPLAIFLGDPTRSALSEAPATAAALLALVLGARLLLDDTPDAAGPRQRLQAPLAGGAAGAALLLRSFYLHPLLLWAAACCGALLWQRGRRALRPVALLLLPLALAISTQLCWTWRYTDKWAFIDPAQKARWTEMHFSSSYIGYDTLLPPAPHPWPAHNVPDGGLSRAVKDKNIKSAISLLLQKQNFYFGTYTPWGRVYLSDPQERIFHRGILVLHIAAALSAGCWLSRLRRRRALLPAAVFLLAIWGEATLIIPESRFLALLQVSLFSLGIVGATRCAQSLWSPAPRS